MTTKKSHSAEVAELSQANKSPDQPASGVPVYELGFHLVPTILEDGVAAIALKVRAILGDAEIINDQFPALMTLAYTIVRSNQGKREKYNEAYFGFIKFATERENLPAMQAKLTALQQVLRFIIVETVREDIMPPHRAVFSSTRLEGETIKKPEAAPEKTVEVSEEELDKSIDALVTTTE